MKVEMNVIRTGQGFVDVMNHCVDNCIKNIEDAVNLLAETPESYDSVSLAASVFVAVSMASVLATNIQGNDERISVSSARDAIKTIEQNLKLKLFPELFQSELERKL